MLLKRHNFAEQLPLLDPAAATSEDAASPSDLGSALQDLYSEVHLHAQPAGYNVMHQTCFVGHRCASSHIAG